MYKVEKRFTVPIGHRLSKHAGRCKNFHGHNIQIYVGVTSQKLNENDMVIDFSNLKELVNQIIDQWDHCLLLNINDSTLSSDLKNEFRIISFPFDPTAEKLCETLYKVLRPRLKQDTGVDIEYVTIFENENSKATYME